ncbi:MAG: SDR family NAD(P)-dependent oxidoreductase [Dehalococcoidales bacterium]|nr:SDR family NAD(P)-dependent oxidoreductase [Dehalococcoidales bacterium]
MDLKFKDRIALVTGVGSQIGYGKCIALTLAKEGCDIIAADIDLEGAQKTARDIEALGRHTLVVQVDVTKRDQVDEMVKKALEKFGRIDILVNNAGVGSEEKPFLEKTRADWDKDIQVNLYGQMNVAQSVLPHMIERHYGRIVTVAGGTGFPLISTYGAAKAGIIAVTQSLAKEVTSMGVVINAVVPGLALTGLIKAAPPEFIESFRQSSQFKRFCTPEDLAPVVAFLASDVCSYMAGQTIYLGGS